jgi:hypothetical protein
MLISNPKAADGYRSANVDASTSGVLLAADTTKTTITALSAKHTIFVQKLTTVITTSAAQVITIKDSNGTAIVIGSIASGAALGSVYTVDFGARGVQLTEGKDLLIVPAAAGPALTYAIEAYQKLTTAAASTTVDRTFA